MPHTTSREPGTPDHADALSMARTGLALAADRPLVHIATAALQNLLGGDEAMARARKPGIMADAAYAIFMRDSRAFTGNLCLDDEILAEEGITDLSAYSHSTEVEPAIDLFVESVTA